MDLRGIPTAVCPNCGNDELKIVVKFNPETYEISMYGLEAECFSCDSLLTAPTPLDIIGNDANGFN
jgi:hypothetical protein